jgi:hypothetical protein
MGLNCGHPYVPTFAALRRFSRSALIEQLQAGKGFCRNAVGAEPSKNPSFWTKKADIEQVLHEGEDFWLPALQPECHCHMSGRSRRPDDRLQGLRDYECHPSEKLVGASTESALRGGGACPLPNGSYPRRLHAHSRNGRSSGGASYK